MRGIVSRSNVAVALFGLVASGCDLLTGNDEKKITISVDNAAVTTGQGINADVVITIARTRFDQPVTLVAQGTLPEGVTTTFTVNPVPNGTATSVLRFIVPGTATPGTATITIRATGEGVAEQSQVVDLTVNVTGSYALSLLNSSVTAAQGGGDLATVLLARTGGNAGNVSLAVSGAPAGVTATFSESPTAARSSGLTIAVSSTVVTGTYTLTITSSSPGITPNQQAQLSLVVITPASTTSIALPFCSSSMPVWFAYQNEGFPWQRVTATQDTFRFAAASKVAIAYTLQNGGETQVNVFFASRAELLGLSGRDCDGTKSLTGTVTQTLTAGQTVIVALGANSASTTTGNYSLSGVASRNLDLVATLGQLTVASTGFGVTPSAMIIRRSQNLTGAIAALDFASASESFAPAASQLTVTGFAGGNVVEFQNTFWSATATYGAVSSGPLPGGTAQVQSVPGTQLIAGDMHELYVDRYEPSGTVGSSVVSYLGALADRAEAIGPLLTMPLITTATSSPYVRLRGQLVSQTEYGTAARFVFVQGLLGSRRFVLLVGTTGYFNGTPTSWDMVVPDFTGTAGFSSAWMLATGESAAYSAEAFASRGDVLFGAIPAPGENIKLAYRVSSTSILLRAFRAQASRERRSPLLTQYLSR